MTDVVVVVVIGAISCRCYVSKEKIYIYVYARVLSDAVGRREESRPIIITAIPPMPRRRRTLATHATTIAKSDTTESAARTYEIRAHSGDFAAGLTRDGNN